MLLYPAFLTLWVLSVWGDLIVEVPTTTYVDLLSRHPQFSTFLRLVQRNGLIPYLNTLTHTTLFAPVNSAFTHPPGPFTKANLTRYLLHQRLTTDDVGGAGIYLSQHHSRGNPHLFTPAIVAAGEGFSINGVAVVEPDLVANTSRNVIQGVGAILPVPRSLCELVDYAYPEAAMFQALFQAHTRNGCHLNNVTVFIPSDKSFNLTAVEIAYLLGNEGDAVKRGLSPGAADRQRIIQHFMVGGYLGGDLNHRPSAPLALDPAHTAPRRTYPNLNHETLTIGSFANGNGLTVQGVETKFANIITDDAVVHLLSNPPVPNPFLDLRAVVEFTPRKILLGLGCSNFVADLVYRKLGPLIDDPTLEQTIFVTLDEVEDPSVVAALGTKSDLYQFVQGQVFLDHLLKESGSTLLDTKLCEPLKLGVGHCAKMKVARVGGSDVMINNRFLVTSKAYTVGRTNIYLTDSEVAAPPADFLTAVAPYFHCSRTLSYLEQLGMLYLPKNHQGYTVFLPCYQAWKELDLTYKYLESNETALRLVLGNMILQGLVYDEPGSHTARTITGESVELRTSGRSLYLNDTRIRMDEAVTDIIYGQGVAHLVKEIIIPDTLTISMTQLINHSTNSDAYFLGLLETYNLDHYLSPSHNYSLLLPTTKSLAFSHINASYPNIETLLRLHLLPPGAIDIMHQCFETADETTLAAIQIPTLLNNTFYGCRPVSPKHLMLHLYDTDGSHEVRILNKGCTNPSSRFNLKANQCLFVIDRAAQPSWNLRHPIRIILHLPWAAMGLGIILGASAIVAVFSCFMVVFMDRKNQGVPSASQRLLGPDLESTVSPQEPRGSEWPPQTYGALDDTMPAERPNPPALNVPTVRISPPHTEAGYSDNAQTQPMKMGLGLNQISNRERNLPPLD